jgi:hypothetical protein
MHSGAEAAFPIDREIIEMLASDGCSVGSG